MAKQLKPVAKKATSGSKPSVKPKGSTKAKAKSQATPKTQPQAKAKPARAKPAIDWAAILRTGKAGVRKWNNLSSGDRLRASIVGADLSNADLTGVKFSFVDLSGVNLRGATLDGAFLGTARFDEKTKWPKEIKLADSLVWKGKGPDPRNIMTPVDKGQPKPADFGEFLSRLKQVTDPAKLDKATAMLKADRFRLFAKVDSDQVVGVVKSQSDPNLVYSCRLGSDGKYACCTQNLNICGGLKGSPCKHLLVLIAGLSQAGALHPGTAHDWTQAARGKKPELDKDQMAATFLLYKGAEAGEIDWRPTETVPEDFYAM
jgi:hypothetical protein